MEIQKVVHPIGPVYDSGSRILILGTMPSPKSREAGFYYSHPRNRFWPVMAALFSEEIPADNEAKRALLLRHHIALWDVLASCEIAGAQDTSIRNPVPNPVEMLLENTGIKAVFTTGQKACQLYQKYCYPITGMQAVALPSTSPANAAMSLERLTEAYSVILKALE